MKLNLRDLLPVSAGLTRNLRRITLGAAIAVAGVLGFSTVIPAAANVTPSSETTIVNRSEKKAKLVLQLPSSDGKMMTQHRSHSSHSSHSSHASHRSHYSSYSR